MINNPYFLPPQSVVASAEDRTMTPRHRQEIEERLKAITPGQWAAVTYAIPNRYAEVRVNFTPIMYCQTEECAADNAIFVAAAPDDIRDLLAALDDAHTLIDVMVRDDTSGAFDAGVMAGRGQALEALHNYYDAHKAAIHRGDMMMIFRDLGLTVPLPHDVLRRDNERLRAALKEILQYAGEEPVDITSQEIAREALEAEG